MGIAGSTLGDLLAHCRAKTPRIVHSTKVRRQPVAKVDQPLRHLMQFTDLIRRSKAASRQGRWAFSRAACSRSASTSYHRGEYKRRSPRQAILCQRPE